MGGKGLVWDVKDSLAADTDAPYRARICHAGCGVCAPAARGRDKARRGERRQSGGQSSRLPREDAPSWHGYGCSPIQRGHLPQRHASSRRLRHRPGAHHRLLPRHRQRQRMFDVPKRHQSCGTVIIFSPHSLEG